MRRVLKSLAGLSVLLLVAAVVLPALLPAGSAAGPYVSALSDVAATSALAAPFRCANKGCPAGSNGRCSKVAGGAGCTIASDGTCTSSICR